jgi:hypothetical protein
MPNRNRTDLLRRHRRKSARDSRFHRTVRLKRSRHRTGLLSLHPHSVKHSLFH